MSESWMTLQLPPKLDGTTMTPEEEVQFWRYFYAESQRLFGNKKTGKEGTFDGLIAKAMRLLKYDAQFFVSRKELIEIREGIFVSREVPVYEYGPPGINKLEQKKAYDAAKRKCWAKQYDPYALAWFFDLYTNPAYYGYKDEGAKVEYLPGPMSQEDAIRKIKEEFRFNTYEAAYKTLKRNPLVKGLTIHTWPK